MISIPAGVRIHLAMGIDWRMPVRTWQPVAAG